MDDRFELPDVQDATAGDPAHQRAAARDSLLLAAMIRRAGDPTPIPARVRNLSAGGLMAETEQPLEQGEQIEIELRNIGTVAGTVAWTLDARSGIAFDTEIDPRLARRPIAAPKPRTAPAPRTPPRLRPRLF